MTLTSTIMVQVWNANACNAVVGAFNLQGSAWDRKKRQYATYNSKPPTLSTHIRVKDVPVFQSPAGAAVSTVINLSNKLTADCRLRLPSFG